jgi:ubiquinol-cytochrome c reductase cytochrome b subunit
VSAPTGDPRHRDLVGWLEQRLNLSELFSLITHFGLVYTPVDSTRPVRDAVRDVAERPVESLALWPRVLGLLAALLFLLEVVTGTLLAFYYQPTAATAFGSTQTIVRDVPFGWFIHQLHAWGAWMLVAIVVVRLVRLFWDGLYQAPREVLWLSALALAWVVLQFDFTGRLLTYDSTSYWSVVRGMEVVFALPVVGPVLSFLLGGHTVSDGVLIRFYVLHLIVLPMLYTVAIYLTFATVRRIGVSPVATRGAAATSTFRDHLFHVALLLLGLFGVMVSLAVLAPFPFRAGADPYATPGGVRPPWYMLAPYAVQQGLHLPPWLGGIVLVAIAFAVPLLPWLARDGHLGDHRRVRLIGVAGLALWVLLSAYGAVMEHR